MTGARVYVTPPGAEDCDGFISAMSASRDLHRPWISMPQTRLEYATYLERSRLATCAFYLARRRADDALLGFLNISEIVRGGFRSAFLGYGAVAPHAGQGYLGEALELVLSEAFGRLRLQRLEASIQPGNRASIALARKAGFELEGFSPRYLKVGGRWRDHERWAIRAETWRGLQRSR